MSTLTPQQERFAQLCTELVNYSAAYRQAYNVGPNTNFRTIGNEASRTAAIPHVAARIRELADLAAAKSCIPSLATRIQELREMEQANPDEILGLRWVNCRWCRGIDHGYQWRDDVEYARACDEHLRMKQPPPKMDGGFDYNGTLEPVADCPHCWGVGERSFHLADTSKLTGGARRLYKGIKIKGNGDVEVLLHDQMQARDMLNRIMGAYKDGNLAQQPPAGQAVAAAAAAKTPEERQRAYLRLVSSS